MDFRNSRLHTLQSITFVQWEYLGQKENITLKCQRSRRKKKRIFQNELLFTDLLIRHFNRFRKFAKNDY
jgi:hypothetical protein